MEQITLKTQRINKQIDKTEINPLTGGIILRSTWKGKLAGNQTKVIKSGVAIHIPEGYYGLVVNSTNIVENYPFLLRTQTITTEDREEIILYVVNYSPYPEGINLNQKVGEILIHPIQPVAHKGVAKISAFKTEEK